MLYYYTILVYFNDNTLRYYDHYGTKKQMFASLVETKKCSGVSSAVITTVVSVDEDIIDNYSI